MEGDRPALKSTSSQDGNLRKLCPFLRDHTLPFLDPDFYCGKIASFRKGNDELPHLTFDLHKVKEVNAARGNRLSGYHTRQEADLLKDLKDQEKTAEESERLWIRYIR